MPFPAVFYTFFPQFTPDPVNDRAWYPGFTDWDLIRKLPEKDARIFRPAGEMYDTADPAYMKKLVEQTANVRGAAAGLMVYHYHFDGTPVLRGFENNLLAAEEVPPFFICWANESWSKRWVGKAGEIIIRQQHLIDIDGIYAHARHLAALFRRPEYLRVGDRPVWLVYNPLAAPTLEESLALYRQCFNKLGLDPIIGTCLSHLVDPKLLRPFDFVAEFQPRFFFGSLSSDVVVKLAARLKAANPRLVEFIGGIRDQLGAKSGNRYFSYKEYLKRVENGSLEAMLREVAGELPVMRGAFYGWNNLPRYGDRSTIVTYEGVEAADLSVFKGLMSDAGFPILINSWNEWSEGAALEPAEVADYLRDAFSEIIMAGR